MDIMFFFSNKFADALYKSKVHNQMRRMGREYLPTFTVKIKHMDPSWDILC